MCFSLWFLCFVFHRTLYRIRLIPNDNLAVIVHEKGVSLTGCDMPESANLVTATEISEISLMCLDGTTIASTTQNLMYWDYTYAVIRAHTYTHTYTHTGTYRTPYYQQYLRVFFVTMWNSRSNNMFFLVVGACIVRIFRTNNSGTQSFLEISEASTPIMIGKAEEILEMDVRFTDRESFNAWMQDRIVRKRRQCFRKKSLCNQ